MGGGSWARTSAPSRLRGFPVDMVSFPDALAGDRRLDPRTWRAWRSPRTRTPCTTAASIADALVLAPRQLDAFTREFSGSGGEFSGPGEGAGRDDDGRRGPGLLVKYVKRSGEDAIQPGVRMTPCSNSWTNKAIKCYMPAPPGGSIDAPCMFFSSATLCVVL